MSSGQEGVNIEEQLESINDILISLLLDYHPVTEETIE
jgi:hypothetical protein